MSVQVQPATADRWSDLVKVFGRRGEDPSWCWCQLFLRSETPESLASRAAPNNRDALQQEITYATTPPGLIAYVGTRPVGWTRVGPRSAFPGVSGNRALARVLPEDRGAWWVTCFAVDSGHRRSGIGSALLKSAVEFAREHGATAVEGHPVDVAGLSAARVGGSAIYTGTMAMFSAPGFLEVARACRTRPVMRLRL
jgi:GNAT superfamily N-acetyltransferase